jgi:hypothetical protein
MRMEDATWMRARGWALWKALIGIDGNAGLPSTVPEAHRVLDDVLADHRAQVRLPSSFASSRDGIHDETL